MPGRAVPGALVRAAIVGEAVPLSLRALVGSAPGFCAPRSVDRPHRLRGFAGGLVVVRGGDPVAVVATVAEVCPGTPVLVLTELRDPHRAVEALCRGATSYLIHAECSRDEFVFALVGTANGQSHMSPSVTTALVRRFHARAPRRVDDALVESLTERDEAFLALLSEGCSNAQIGARLCLAEKTVRNYVSRLYAKLAVGSRAEAIVWWLHHWSL